MLGLLITHERGRPAVSREYVGIDLHRRRSVIVRMDEVGETLSTVSIENDPVALALEVAKAGPDPDPERSIPPSHPP